MKLAIISLSSGSSQMIAEKAKAFFDEVDMLSIKKIEVHLGSKNKHQIIYEGKPIKDYDCVYCKGSYKYALLSRSIIAVLEDRCYTPLLPESYTLGHDKFLTLIELQKAGIEIPKTYLAGTVEEAKKLVANSHFPAIIKIPSGTHGKGVMFADSVESANSILDALEVFKQPYIIQEYVETGATDLRALVLGDKVIAAMQRKAPKGELRANIHMGGKGKKITLDPDTEYLAVKSAKSIKADLCAIDILKGLRPYVVEVNVSPGIQGLTKATKLDIADEIAKFLFEKTKEYQAVKANKDYKKVMKELKQKDSNEFLANLNVKAGIIRLPESVTASTNFKPEDEVVIKVSEGKVSIEKHDIEK
ncbi:RimK family alpha-L-glutamate ligase [Candidatus Woesearchaeota archaeon]|nr:RimK family alpha-L-glutamate ligase [Candidatus Woesearchaeota archaeon]